MNILLHCGFDNKVEWEKSIKKIFKNEKIFLVKDNPDFDKIDCAILWNIPNNILKKLVNLRVIFSLGAGVDHILKLSNYKLTPIIRVRDSSMAKRMSYHVLSQILEYQLNLKFFQKAQISKMWQEGLQFQRQVKLNEQIKVGILGVGFLGQYVAKFLQKLDYQLIGFKKSAPKKKSTFPIYVSEGLDTFIKSSNIIVSILPATTETNNFIDKNFLKKMKQNSLLINVGRGSSINESDLISHLNKNKNFFVSLDVFKKEPLIKKSLLWNMSNVTITPHVASLTQVDIITDQMYKKFLMFKKDKKIKTDVNLKKGY
jgi:glyoxylate/hydroxypyruvate reductase A